MGVVRPGEAGDREEGVTGGRLRPAECKPSFRRKLTDAVVQNIEIKTPLHCRDDVERRLGILGARREWVRRQKDTFYDVPNGWLKLREVEGQPAELISYRRTDVPLGLKSSDYDVEAVGDGATWRRLLGRVMDVASVVEKERTLWLYKHTRIHLDRVVRRGEFLELETVVRGISSEDASREARCVIDALKLHEDEFISVPYRELPEASR